MNRAVLFSDWAGVLRVLLVGSMSYVALIVVLRITGKRTLSKMNAFDLVVTVALGSALSSTMLSKDTALAEGVAGLMLLVCLQYVVTWLSVRNSTIRSMVKAEPRLLVQCGEFLREGMRIERITEDEVLAAVRASGAERLRKEHMVVLETDGTLSVQSNTSENISAAGQ